MRKFISLAIVAVLLGGCAGQTEKPSRYSGFLSTNYYDRLTKVEIPSGQILFRYLDPDFIPSNYHQVIVDPVDAYPEPKKNKHMSMDMLQNLKSRFTTFLENGFSKVLPLTETPGVGVLRLQIAITGVDVSSKGLEPYEYLPFALIVAGASTAAGGRDQEVNLFVEGRIVDSATNKVLGVGIRQIRGEDLENANTELQVDRLDKGLKAAGSDFVTGLNRLFSK